MSTNGSSLKGGSWTVSRGFRGLRIPVSVIADMAAHGMSDDDLDLYPDLETEDIHVAVAYAKAEAAGGHELTEDESRPFASRSHG
jgi:hypothetical protein